MVLVNPGDATIENHFNVLKQSWVNKAEEVTALVDTATDTLDFVKASEEAMVKEQTGALEGLDQQNLAVRFISNCHCKPSVSIAFLKTWFP